MDFPAAKSFTICETSRGITFDATLITPCAPTDMNGSVSESSPLRPDTPYAMSKVEAEQAALKIVRVAKDLENARLQALAREVDDKRKEAEKDESSKAKLTE